MNNLDAIKNMLTKTTYDYCAEHNIKQHAFIEIQYDGHNINVVKNGEVVQSFNELSNDYALTEAYRLKEKLSSP